MKKGKYEQVDRLSVHKNPIKFRRNNKKVLTESIKQNLAF